MWHDVVNKMDVVVAGGGSSSRSLEGWEYKNIVGCGSVSQYLKLWKYCYGDIAHLNNIPDCPEVIASSRNFNDKPGMIPFPEVLPFAGSAGGMAISIACSSCKPGSLIGVIGFDGLTELGDLYYPDSIDPHKELMKYWINKGYVLVSLMHVSVFNSVLLRWTQAEALMKGLSKGVTIED